MLEAVFRFMEEMPVRQAASRNGYELRRYPKIADADGPYYLVDPERG